MKEPGFWFGDMPTQPVSKPFTYEKWEYPEPLPWHVDPLKDIAAMGRVWYLEALACRRMKEHGRLLEGARRVCRAGLKSGGYWRERYYPHADGTVAADGAMKYCEYPAILVAHSLRQPGSVLALAGLKQLRRGRGQSHFC